MMRFVRYAVEHEKKIRAVFLLDGQMMQKTVSIDAYSDETVSIRFAGRKTPVTLPLADLLSCDYARGDHGEE